MDGSKTEKGTSAGVFGPGIKYSQPMGIYPSVLQTEINAFGRLHLHLDENYRKQSIAIYSDSQAAITAVSSHNTTSAQY